MAAIWQNTNVVEQVYAEATIAFPLIVAATFAKVDEAKKNLDPTLEP